MHKTDLIAAVAASTGSSKADVKAILESIQEEIVASVVKGESVVLTGFGTFSQTQSAERKGRHPSTGDEITIPARKNAKFKVGSPFKDAVNS